MRIKPKTTGQKIADTIITQVDKLENDDLILQLQKYIDEGRGYLPYKEQSLMSRAIAELVKLQDQVVALKEELLDTIEGAGVLHERIEEANIKISEYVPPPARTEIPPPYGTYTTGDCTLSIQNILNICREDEQNQLAEMLNLQEEANKNNQEFNKSNMK